MSRVHSRLPSPSATAATRPWKLSMPLYRRLEKGAQLGEYICVEVAEELMYGHLRRRPGTK